MTTTTRAALWLLALGLGVQLLRIVTARTNAAAAEARADIARIAERAKRFHDEGEKKPGA